MKLLLLISLVNITCNSNHKIKIEEATSDNQNVSDKGIFVSQIQAEYKHGGNDVLLSEIYNSLSKLRIENAITTLGIYRMDIEINGKTSNFQTIRTISKKIDNEIAKICNTIEFYPSTIKGSAVKSKITIPIRIEFR